MSLCMCFHMKSSDIKAVITLIVPDVDICPPVLKKCPHKAVVTLVSSRNKGRPALGGSGVDGYVRYTQED